MPPIRAIAIETSGRAGALASALDDRLIEHVDFAHGLQHASHIVPILDQLCARQGWKPRDLDEMYVSAGPGSFTGLRIGITLAKTLAFATGVKIVAVPTMDVLVQNAPAGAIHVLVVLDARQGRAFTALYERAPAGTPPSSPLPATFSWIERSPARLHTLAEAIAAAPRPLLLLGEGVDYHRAAIPADAGISIAPASAFRARPEALVHVGHALARAGRFADPFTLAPTYIRLPDAVEKLAARADPPAPRPQ